MQFGNVPIKVVSDEFFTFTPHDCTLEELQEFLESESLVISTQTRLILQEELKRWRSCIYLRKGYCYMQPAIAREDALPRLAAEAFENIPLQPFDCVEWQHVSDMITAALHCMNDKVISEIPHLFSVFVSISDRPERRVFSFNRIESGEIQVSDFSWGAYIDGSAIICLPFKIGG